MNRRHFLAAAAATASAAALPRAATAATVEDGYLILDPDEQRALVDALANPHVPPGDTEPYYRVTAPQPVRLRLRAVQLAFVSQGLAAGGFLPYGVWLYPHGGDLAIQLQQAYDLHQADL